MTITININNKSAAMFGLDARIALAIFGALSIITGASLYNAIQDTKVVAIMTEFDNIEKAVTNYWIDTGILPPVANPTVSGELKLEELLTSSKAGWVGPYLPLTDAGTAEDGYLDHPTYNQVIIFSQVETSWGTPVAGNKCYSSSSSCNVYICITGLPLDLKNSIDLKIDGSDDRLNGLFVHDDTSNANGWACKKTFPFPLNQAPAP